MKAKRLKNFNKQRGRKQPLNSFVGKNIPEWNRDIVLKMARELNMDTSRVTAYILALWNGVQDMVYMHLNFDLGCFQVRTTNKQTPEYILNRVNRLRCYYRLPYGTNRRLAKQRCLKMLATQHRRLLKDYEVQKGEIAVKKYRRNHIEKIKRTPELLEKHKEWEKDRKAKKTWKKSKPTKLIRGMKYVFQDEFRIHNYNFNKKQKPQIVWR